MMISRKRILAILIALAITLIIVPEGFAHPLGNFTINHFAGVLVERDAIGIEYILDMAEIPAFQEITRLDSNQNGNPDPAEITGFPAAQCAQIQPLLSLTINGQRAPLKLSAASVEFPPGVGGLFTLRLSCSFIAELSGSGNPVKAHFQNQAFATRQGWREIILLAEDLSIEGSVKTESVSDRLRTYPEDLLASPLDDRELLLELDQAAGHVRILDPDALAAGERPAPPNAASAEFPLGVALLLAGSALLAAGAVSVIFLRGRRTRLAPERGSRS